MGGRIAFENDGAVEFRGRGFDGVYQGHIVFGFGQGREKDVELAVTRLGAERGVGDVFAADGCSEGGQFAGRGEGGLGFQGRGLGGEGFLGGFAPGNAVQGQAEPGGGIAGNEKKMFASEFPEATHPAVVNGMPL